MVTASVYLKMKRTYAMNLTYLSNPAAATYEDNGYGRLLDLAAGLTLAAVDVGNATEVKAAIAAVEPEVPAEHRETFGARVRAAAIRRAEASETPLRQGSTLLGQRVKLG